MTPKQVVALIDKYRILEAARQEAWARVFSETRGDRTELENQARGLEEQVSASMRRISQAVEAMRG